MTPQLLLLSVLLTEPDADPAAAESAFEEGIAHFEGQEYAAALRAFERAYALAPNYRVLFDIGVTHLELGHRAAAYTALERFLEEGGEDVDGDKREAVQTTLREIRPTIAPLRIETDFEGATAEVDGRAIGTVPSAAAVYVDFGRHEVRVLVGGEVRKTKVVEVDTQDPLTVEINAPSPPPPTSVVHRPEPPPPVTDQPPPKPPRAGLLWIGWAGAAALAGAAIGTGVGALRAQSRLREELAMIPADEAAIQADRRQMTRLALATDVLTALASVGAVASLVATVVVFRRRR